MTGRPLGATPIERSPISQLNRPGLRPMPTARQICRYARWTKPRPFGQSARVSSRDSVAARVQAIGVDEVGGRYLAALAAPDDGPDQWACPDSDGDLWILGDGSFDQLAAEPG